MGNFNQTQMLDCMNAGVSAVDPARFGIEHRGTKASRALISSLFTLQEGAFGALLDWELDQDLSVHSGDPIIVQSKDGGELVSLHLPTSEELSRQSHLATPQGPLQDADVLNRMLRAARFVDPTGTPRTMALVLTVLRLCDRVLTETGPLPCRTSTTAYALATLLREVHGASLSHAAYAADDTADLSLRLESEATTLARNAGSLAAAAGATLGRRLAQYLVMRMGIGPTVPSLDHFSAQSWLPGFGLSADRALRRTAFVPLIVVPVSQALTTFWRGAEAELRALPAQRLAADMPKGFRA